MCVALEPRHALPATLVFPKDADWEKGGAMGQAAQQADERLVIAKATLMDDLYMAKFFEGQPRCAEVVLRAVLGNPSLRVISVNVRRDVLSLGSRSVQLDIAAEDEDGRLYDVEVQRDPGRAEPQRARLYAALIDSQALGKGAGFADLPESYVIFIVNGDALGDGVPPERLRAHPSPGREAFRRRFPHRVRRRIV